ncbi:MAG TPA: hypothetical protein VLG36_01090 [Candidatus Chromulinivoraceae bacterium]|nr:hypothetical protein [Candidatus Chromulinivoraceae bacterium]
MKKLVPWASAVLILVTIFGTIYGVLQQAQRSGANLPQIQLAEDIAVAINKGAHPSSVLTAPVDMNASLAPFIIVYDKSGRVVDGSGLLDSSIPTIPKGVLTAADGQVYNAVTWQPKSGVRIAAIAVRADNYYVVSGRSLAEVEKNETKTLQLSLTGGVIAFLITILAFVVEVGKNRTRSRRSK